MSDTLINAHKAEPQAIGVHVSACRHCGAAVVIVPGGHGPVWVHEETGMIVGSGHTLPEGAEMPEPLPRPEPKHQHCLCFVISACCWCGERRTDPHSRLGVRSW